MEQGRRDADAVVDELRRLHRAVDLMAAPVAAAHAGRLRCQRGCAACCIDGVTVFNVEAELIRRVAPLWAQGETPRAEGACAFLDGEGACRIYPVRPYVCRTQGLPLRWLDELNGELLEYRDICELNEEGPPLEELDPATMWAVGPVEERLARLQLALDGELVRVELRALWSEGVDKEPDPRA